MVQSGERRCRAMVAVDLGFATCRTHARSALLAQTAASLHGDAPANVVPISGAHDPPAPGVELRSVAAEPIRFTPPAAPPSGRCTHQAKVYQLTADPDRLTLACRDCGHAAFTMIPRCTVDGAGGRCPRPVLGGLKSGMTICSQHAARGR
jgi:hypothetical protein